MISKLLNLIALFQTCLGIPRAPSGAWDQFNYAPSSRTVSPASIHSVVGSVTNPEGLLTDGDSATFFDNGSYVVVDFGKEVGGVLSFTITDATSSSALSLSFTESPQFISPHTSDSSTRARADHAVDGVEALLPPLVRGNFTQPRELQRGGFRYLVIVSNSDDSVGVSNITLEVTFMPHWEDALDSYTGYFYAKDHAFEADDDFLTKIWYAGAYTVQTNTISSHEMRLSDLNSGWLNNASAGVPEPVPVLTDGSKRDRWIWPGDMGVSIHTQLVSTTDLVPTKNALSIIFGTQAEDGSLDYAGPPANIRGSATYVAWNLIGTHTYWIYTGDLDMVREVWTNYTKAVDFLASHLDEETGLLSIPPEYSFDWGRDGGSGRSIAPNALFYQTLLTGAELATQLGETDLADIYTQNATALKTAFNEILWDKDEGLYRDNDDPNSIHPQDGNSLAVLYNLTTSSAQNKEISEGLTQFWTDIGPVSPELNDTIIPFIGGFELRAHFIAGEGARALDLMRREWGYMLYTNLSVQSTLLEGFTVNGSLGYRATAGYDFDHSYTSHAHGWSTGPTSALTFHVLGIQLTAPQGSTFTVAPVLSSLSAAEGGLSTDLGFFGVNWTLSEVWTLVVTAPNGTIGTVSLPDETDWGTLQVNGISVVPSDLGQVKFEGGSSITVSAEVK